jgi:hypothetical protein
VSRKDEAADETVVKAPSAAAEIQPDDHGVADDGVELHVRRVAGQFCFDDVGPPELLLHQDAAQTEYILAQGSLNLQGTV